MHTLEYYIAKLSILSDDDLDALDQTIDQMRRAEDEQHLMCELYDALTDLFKILNDTSEKQILSGIIDRMDKLCIVKDTHVRKYRREIKEILKGVEADMDDDD